MIPFKNKVPQLLKFIIVPLKADKENLLKRLSIAVKNLNNARNAIYSYIIHNRGNCPMKGSEFMNLYWSQRKPT